ncbi:MAG: hypothetical protein DMF71_02535 [Acidobacteria bacterium]|nr:MAG: hypothetical protein DMF71_02535 [Acidobacteriota bacterium]
MFNSQNLDSGIRTRYKRIKTVRVVCIESQGRRPESAPAGLIFLNEFRYTLIRTNVRTASRAAWISGCSL